MAFRVFQVPPLDRPIGLAYDYILHTIFYTEFKTSSIKGVDLYANTGQAMIIKHGQSGNRIYYFYAKYRIPKIYSSVINGFLKIINTI